MSILDQVKLDINSLKETISNCGSDPFMQKHKNGLTVELENLEVILASGVIPEKYHSPVMHADYEPSEEEKKKRLEPLPPAKHSYIGIKASRKATQKQLSEVSIYQNDETKPEAGFLLEHKVNKNYPNGSFADRVKKGYVNSLEEPKYAIKSYRTNVFIGNSIHECRLAMRSAYCYKQLGRSGFAYRSHFKQFSVTDWLNGINLYDADQKQIQSMPIPQRIMMAISVLREVNILHKQGLIHNDIKPLNLMVNYGKLNLADLDSVHPKNEVPKIGTTHMYSGMYLDAQTSYKVFQFPQGSHLVFNERTDLHALGLTLTYLFQEIYTPKEVVKVTQINGTSNTYKYDTISLNYGPKYSEHEALAKLLNYMIFGRNGKPETAETYIEDFFTVLKTYSDHEKYLADDKFLANHSIEATKKDGVKAFHEIECEIVGINQRMDQMVAKYKKLK